ncbi:hypothetical protein DO97_17510 [Neosynechococcus sphagnicola sy1]|uniref:DUF6788 domain-containing protein n=1 Tax=Neosynechococcus sphagnicola sy1 TaxID=1497020 RepID=A0A098TL43_9CYAN|nr:hypothetical protein [Neosynechococcus sphagnicola]KGF71563.1 hypothetical protein DO97_17510 [Neosynechococcus sphagnicola sy1]
MNTPYQVDKSPSQRIQLGLIPGLDHTLVDGEWLPSDVRHQAAKNDIQVAAAAGAFVPGDDTAAGSIDAAPGHDTGRGFKPYPVPRKCSYHSPFSDLVVEAIAVGERAGLVRIEYTHRGTMAESDVPPATVEFTAPSLSCVTDKEEPVTQDISYQQQYRRCGKPTCGTCPHGPYWYAYWRDGAKVKSRYIGKELHKSAIAASRSAGETSM